MIIEGAARVVSRALNPAAPRLKVAAVETAENPITMTDPIGEELHRLSTAALARLQRRPRIVDIGAQGVGGHPYGLLTAFAECDIVGFEPLEHRLKERLESEGSERLTLLPYAVGDGSVRAFHVVNDDGCSSLLPLNHRFNQRFNHIAHIRAVRVEAMPTVKLDDVLPEGPVDLLKLDVQGAELLVLQGAERTLADTGVIHCEVEFGPIYAGQPLFGDIQAFLAQQGFEFIDLLNETRYHYLEPAGNQYPERLLAADAIFFKEASQATLRASQALIAAQVYHKASLARHLLFAPGS